jgi:hypothetical protein
MNPFEIEVAANSEVSNLAKQENITTYCELGCNYGNTAYRVATNLSPKSQMYLFDFNFNITKAKEKLKQFIDVETQLIDSHFFCVT